MNWVLQLNNSQSVNSFNSLLEKFNVLNSPNQPNQNSNQSVIDRGNLRIQNMCLIRQSTFFQELRLILLDLSADHLCVLLHGERTTSRPPHRHCRPVEPFPKSRRPSRSLLRTVKFWICCRWHSWPPCKPWSQTWRRLRGCSQAPSWSLQHQNPPS